MNVAASKKLSYLYFLMTAFIIGIHSVSTSSMGFTGFTKTVNDYMRIFFDAATGAFFFFSAFLLFRKERNYNELLKNKIKSLVVPYLLFNTIALLYKQVLRNVVLNHKLPVFSIAKLVRDIFLAGANPPLWFMRVLFEFVILYPIIKLAVNHKRIAAATIVLSLILHLIIGVDVGYSTIQYWLPMYLMGAVLGLHYEKRFCQEKKHKGVIALVGIAALSLLIIGAAQNRYLYYFYRLLAPILLWQIFDCFSALPEPKWWIKCTVFYYGLHILVISPIAKGYSLIFGSSIIMQILANVAVPIICIGVLGCVAAVIRKVFPTIWRILIGGRT